MQVKILPARACGIRNIRVHRHYIGCVSRNKMSFISEVGHKDICTQLIHGKWQKSLDNVPSSSIEVVVLSIGVRRVA